MNQFEDNPGKSSAKKGLSPVIIIAGLALVVAVILIVWFATRGPKTSTITPSPSPVASVEPSPSPSPSPSPVVEASPSPAAVASEWTLEKLEQVVKENTPIYFVKDSARLLPGEKQKIVNMSEAMSHYQNVMLKFRGHTAAFNLPIFRYELSVRRALTVRWMFEYRVGYDLTAIEIRGLGSTELVKKGNKESDRAPNRRVEVIVQHAEPKT
jgi:outer membrane protein OmpA-like peptidoglycan-associated protein